MAPSCSTAWLRLAFGVLLLASFVHGFSTPGGRREGAAGAAALKLKEDVEFLKANLTALWDIVASLQARAAEERQDESDELVLNLGLKKNQTWSPAFKNSFDSQIRVSLKNDAKTYPALSATYWLYKRKDYTTWRRVKDTDELYFWHRGTTLLLHLLKPDGGVQQLKLGDSLQDPDAAPQVNIGVGVWLAAELEDKLSYSLVSQVQAPGFEMSKLEMGQEADLTARYPQSADLIRRLSPPRRQSSADAAEAVAADADADADY